MRSVGFGLSFVLGVQLAVPPALVAADLASIQRRGYLIVGVKDNLRPLGFRNTSGELVGLEIDIARRLAEVILGDADALELRPISNVDRLAVVIEDKVDMTIAGVTMTPSRGRVVAFSEPYYLDGIGLISCDRTITQLADLQQSRIAVLENSSAIANIRYQFPQAALVTVASYQSAKAVLEQNRADAFAGDITVLSGWIQEFPKFHLLPSFLSAEPLAIVMPKGNQYRELQRTIDEYIRLWHETGWLEERATYWGLP